MNSLLSISAATSSDRCSTQIAKTHTLAYCSKSTNLLLKLSEALLHYSTCSLVNSEQHMRNISTKYMDLIRWISIHHFSNQSRTNLALCKLADCLSSLGQLQPGDDLGAPFEQHIRVLLGHSTGAQPDQRPGHGLQEGLIPQAAPAQECEDCPLQYQAVIHRQRLEDELHQLCGVCLQKACRTSW